MYAIHRQVHRPTGIEQSLYCNFYSGHEKNLVVAGVNQLHVYRLNSDVEVRNWLIHVASITTRKMDSKFSMTALKCTTSSHRQRQADLLSGQDF